MKFRTPMFAALPSIGAGASLALARAGHGAIATVRATAANG